MTRLPLVALIVVAGLLNRAVGGRLLPEPTPPPRVPYVPHPWMYIVQEAALLQQRYGRLLQS